MASSAERAAERMYYIVTTAHRAIWPGGVLLFWAANHSGYSTFLEQAGKYTESEAREICSLRPQQGKPQEFMVPCDVVEAQAIRVVDYAKLNELTRRAALAHAEGRDGN